MNRLQVHLHTDFFLPAYWVFPVRQKTPLEGSYVNTPKEVTKEESQRKQRDISDRKWYQRLERLTLLSPLYRSDFSTSLFQFFDFCLTKIVSKKYHRKESSWPEFNAASDVYYSKRVPTPNTTSNRELAIKRLSSSLISTHRPVHQKPGRTSTSFYRMTSKDFNLIWPHTQNRLLLGIKM